MTACSSLPQSEGDGDYRKRLHSHALNDTTEDDVKTEITFGRNVAGRVLSRFDLVKDEVLNRYINLIGVGLAAGSSRTELKYHFAVLDSDTVNAYSAPGGYIFITRGAINEAQDEAEVAAVLAHEIAHVTERHIVEALNIKAADESAGAGLGRLMSSGGDAARVAFTQVVDKAVNILFESGYSQADELESDRVGTLLLALAGYDPTALKRYLDRAHKQESFDSAINTTHPPSTQRLDALAQLLEQEQLSSEGFMRNTERFNQHVKN